MCFEYPYVLRRRSVRGNSGFMGGKKKREAVPEPTNPGWSASKTNGFEKFRTNHQTKISMLAQYRELDGVGGFTG